MQDTPEVPRKRPGRKRNPRLIEVSVTLDSADLAQLDEIALELGRSRSDLIREAVRRAWLGDRGKESG
jgi:metal-responsive CopG/Arc/MetJ family transcriptional regulator